MILLETDRGVTVLTLWERYDSLNERALEELRQALMGAAEGAERPWLVVDMSATQFIGSSFVGLLHRAARQTELRNGRLVLCGVSPFCAEVLAALGMASLFDQHPHRAAAVAALSGST